MDKDIGTITVLMERLEKQRLPRILSLKEKVDAGTPLDEQDLDFLEKVMTDARNVIPLIERHPEYQLMTNQVLSLYKDITDKALQLEKDS
jgi:hypothetical protein